MYGMLQKPPLSPPSWVFPAVWSVLYIFMGISAANIYIIGGKSAYDLFCAAFSKLFLEYFVLRVRRLFFGVFVALSAVCGGVVYDISVL